MDISKSTPVHFSIINRELEDRSYYKYTYTCRTIEDYEKAYADVVLVMNRYGDEWCVGVTDVCSESRVVAIILEIIKKQGNT